MIKFFGVGLEPPQFEQPQYHMFHRERFEVEYFPLYNHPYNYGTLTRVQNYVGDM
jgi:hypothetical protein